MDIESLVKGWPCCSLCYECTEPPARHVSLCELHLERVAHLVLDPNFTPRSLRALQTTSGEFGWSLPTSVAHLAYIKNVLNVMIDRRHISAGAYECYVRLNTDLINLHWEIGLVNVGSPNITVNEYIRYPTFSTRKSIVEHLESHQACFTAAGALRSYDLIHTYMKKFLTTGHSLGEIRQKSLFLGFEEGNTTFFH
jgi:hypothetical protein